MLEEVFTRVYTKFKLHFYQSVFSRFQNREASLTTVETFCMEIINVLGRPTVNEFANFVHISAPNAVYRINNLVQKGYVKKERSPQDRREYNLSVTQKYVDYYDISYQYVRTVMERIQKRFTAQEVEKFEEMLQVISNELMPEIPLERMGRSGIGCAGEQLVLKRKPVPPTKEKA